MENCVMYQHNSSLTDEIEPPTAKIEHDHPPYNIDH